ncbi:MAG: NapC/NirT family cytochrome c [Siculibacillus sp.]
MTDTNTTGEKRPGLVKRFWNALWTPSGTIALGVLLIVGFLAGVVFWGGFNWALEMTNREEFCISCHEMKDNVYAEYKQTPHFQNSSGVRATCPDCHVPKDWEHKIIRKIQATQELWGHFVTQSIWTKEKFDAKRIDLARHEWQRMKSTDSRECRNCHNFDSMDFTKQETRAGKAHQGAIDQGKTCIDCHQGIAHRLPQGGREAYDELMKTMKKSDADPARDSLKSYAAALPAK